MGAERIWAPSPEVVERANVTRLMRRQGIASYPELVARSQADPEWFWPAVVEDLELPFDTPFSRVLDTSAGIEWARWFLGGTLNVARACVHRHAEQRPAEEAVIGLAEDGSRSSLTWTELSGEVVRLAEGLARLGVRPGDRVALYLPMCPEAVIASHACAHVGAVQVPVFSGFAAPAVAERLAHAEARVVVTVDATVRKGRTQPLKAILDEALRAAPSVERVVVARRLGLELALEPARDAVWEDLTGASDGRLEALPLDAEHPYLVAYTSGTTGKPKGAVHATGGFLVKIAAEVAYQADLHPGERLLFATDLGWIMGPWTVVGAGANGGTIVLAEGAPDTPPDRLWEIVERERVSCLGLSPTLVRALIPHGDEQARRHDLSSLRTFVTTGEPWNPDPYRWLFDVPGGGRVPIVNISGGTEVGACFLSCTHVEPIKACSLGFPALGMDVDVVDERGRSLPPGEVGELVCRRPWPAMTRGFWRDSERYLDTYWRRLPGLWVHGDFASTDADGYWYLHGRSDDTLNIAGKRIGPAELESAAVSHPDVQEAAAVGVPHPVKGETAWLVCVPRGDSTDSALREEIAERVAEALGRAFRPERVLLVPALPRTRSQKIVRRAVRAAALGTDPGDLSSVENPDAVAEIAAAAGGLTEP